MDFSIYISSEMAILIPTIYIVGIVLKLSNIKDKYIPVILSFVGIILAIFISTELNLINRIIQGILCTGCATFCNQLVVQAKKDE